MLDRRYRMREREREDQLTDDLRKGKSVGSVRSSQVVLGISAKWNHSLTWTGRGEGAGGREGEREGRLAGEGERHG